MLSTKTVASCQALLHVILITELGFPRSREPRNFASNYRFITSLRLLLYVAFPLMDIFHLWMAGISVDGRNVHAWQELQ